MARLVPNGRPLVQQKRHGITPGEHGITFVAPQRAHPLPERQFTLLPVVQRRCKVLLEVNPFRPVVGLFSAGRKLETGKVTVHRVDQRYPTSFGDGGTTRWTTDVGFDDAVLPGMSIPLHFQVAQTPKAHVREELDSLFQNRVIPTLLAGGTHTENRWILPKFASHEGNDWLPKSVR